MQDLTTFRLFDRISLLLEAEERKGCTARGLKLVHARILDYLALCSSQSDTPLAVAEYLGLTKGTVSQSINVLERKGYIYKKPDHEDGRVVHLSLSSMGKQLLADLKPLHIFEQAEKTLSSNEMTTVGTALNAVLAALQQASHSKSFGVCGSCVHYKMQESSYQCALAQIPVDSHDTDRLCRYHEPIHTV